MSCRSGSATFSRLSDLLYKPPGIIGYLRANYFLNIKDFRNCQGGEEGRTRPLISALYSPEKALWWLWWLPPTPTSVPETTGGGKTESQPQVWPQPGLFLHGAGKPAPGSLGHQASTQRAHSEWRRPKPPRSCNAPLALEDTTVPGQKQTLGLHGHSPGDGNSGPLLGSGDRQTSAGCGSHQRQEGQAEGQLCHLHVQVTKQEHSAAA